MKFNESQQDWDYLSRKKHLLQKIECENIAEDFPMFVSRQELARYLVRYELFKRVLNVKGSIVECGVYRGAGIMLFAQLSAMFEPYAFNRQIIGFDTFEGFPHVDKKDGDQAYVADLSDANLDVLNECVEVFNLNRPLSHIPKVTLVKGDSIQTIPQFVKDNPHLLIALLYLDFDLYTPTKVALDTFLPRMPKGAILAFDELNEKRWQGETVALLESFDLRNLQIEKFPEEPHISFVCL